MEVARLEMLQIEGSKSRESVTCVSVAFEFFRLFNFMYIFFVLNNISEIQYHPSINMIANSEKNADPDGRHSLFSK